MRVAMIGTGYVGLVSGACFSEFGHHVVCVDKDSERIAMIGRHEMPIFEPGLKFLVERNIAAGRLTFTTKLAESVKGAQALFIAVGTPSRRGDGEADLSYVFAAAAEIAPFLDDRAVVITKSTVPVGTGREVRRVIAAARPTLQFEVVSNPEFLREGSAIEDFMRPDRVVCGAESRRAREVMRALYRPLFLNETPVLFTSLEAAELIKYASNAFLAAKITFINEMADFCEKVGVNVQDVARGIGLDRRIGPKFLHAGPGFGGSCFPKDARALVGMAQRVAAPSRLIETVLAVNEQRKRAMARRVIAAAGGSMQGKTVAVLGVTFKPNTDDMRESPSLDIVPALQAAGAAIRAYDPEGMDEARKLLPGVVWCKDTYDAMTGADLAVIITEWNQFRALDLARVKGLLKQPVMVDFRNIYRPVDVAAAGIEYHSLGQIYVPPSEIDHVQELD
jgi:UDPglucose 6-dehydrogenase